MTGRRGHGEGNVSFRRHDGRWQAYVSLAPYGGKPGQRKYVYADTEGEVIRKKKDLEAKLAAGLPIPDERLTVGQWLDRWLVMIDGEVSLNTHDQYGWAAGHIKEGLGGVRLRDLRPSHVSEFLKGKASGYSKSSTGRFRAVLVQAIKAAEVEGIVHRNVAALVSNPAGSPSPGRSLSRDQAQKLLATARGNPRGAPFIVALTLGLRPGEVLGLQWSDVDFDNGTVHIRRSLKSQRTGLSLGDLKTAGSRRLLGAPQETISVLKTHRRAQAEQRLRVGEAWQDNDLVFPTQIGTPWDPANFRRTFARLTNEAGIGKWTPNELRHSAVSFMHAEGAQLEEIADVVGHDSTRMTAGVYRHLLTPVVTAGVEPMERLLGDGD